MRFADLLGHTLSTVDTMSDGTIVEHDALGNVLHRTSPFDLTGHATVRNSFGVVVETLQRTPMGLQHLSPTGMLLGTDTSFAGQIQLRDALSRQFGSWDPLSGNLTNSIGGLAGRLLR